MFREDLKFGERYQDLLLKLIAYDECRQARGCFKDWDIWTRQGEDEITFEVKADRMAQRTGNLAIELGCNGKPSGLTASKADYWAYFLHGTNTYYMIPTEELRKIVNESTAKREVFGGDGKRAHIALLPVSEVEAFRDTYDKQNVLVH